MSKYSLPLLFSFALCLPALSSANEDVQSLKLLDDRALSTEYAQLNSLSVLQDQYRFTAQDVVKQALDDQNLGQYLGLSHTTLADLGTRFYTNVQGQTVLQIQRDVVSLGVIETTLSVDGLRQLGQHFIDEFKALAFE